MKNVLQKRTTQLLVFSLASMVLVTCYVVIRPLQRVADISERTTNVASAKNELVKKAETEPEKVEQAQQAEGTTTVQTKSQTTQSTSIVQPPPVTSQTTQPASSLLVTSIYLSQPAVFCGSSGDYYIVQIGDVNIGLSNNGGGTISYGYETRGIPNDWGSYRQSGTVPTGTWTTSFNTLYWGGSAPHMAYSQVLNMTHPAGAVRAVIYSPNTIYSSWVDVPAHNAGEKCQ